MGGKETFNLSRANKEAIKDKTPNKAIGTKKKKIPYKGTTVTPKQFRSILHQEQLIVDQVVLHCKLMRKLADEPSLASITLDEIGESAARLKSHGEAYIKLLEGQ